jgi:hypothetical protein
MAEGDDARLAMLDELLDGAGEQQARARPL